LRHDYEIEYRGRVIRCRTERALARALHVLDAEPETNDKRWTVEEFSIFTDRIRVTQRKLLQALLEYGTAWLSDDRLRVVLGVANNQALAGVLSGISKTALALDIEPARVYVSRTQYKSGKPGRWYRIASGFLRTAAKRTWPKESDLTDERVAIFGNEK
jgi:hypothetical protein